VNSVNTDVEEVAHEDSARDGEVIQEISNWLIDQGLKGGELGAILSGFCQRVTEATGVPLQRAMMGLRTLHPSVDAESFIWNRDGEVRSESFAVDPSDDSGWRRSPIYHMTQTGELSLRRRLEGGADAFDFPILGELQAAGGTDYQARVTPFALGDIQAMETGMISSWVTDRPGGFSDHDMAILDRLIPRLALTAKTLLTQEIAENVLDTYVGPDAGRRIMGGNIRRGSLEVIRAVLIYADLRGFTRLTDSVERDSLAPMLDAYFDQMVPPVVERGGQVLKFLGDGLLATFNLEDQPRDSVCQVALQTGVETLLGVRRLNVERRAAGLPVMDLDIAMHLGDVLYGNVGAADRQDFTVIGPTVNEASRIEVLCQELGHNLLISETFANAATACADRLIPLGSHDLRGVRRAQELYTVDLSKLSAAPWPG
jgi:adenylate cyclase